MIIDFSSKGQLSINTLIKKGVCFLLRSETKRFVMEKYRKPDQYYVDKYDRMTISELKKLEAKEAEELTSLSDPLERWQMSTRHSMHSQSFRNRAISNARNRESTIQKWMLEDERMDRLLATHPEPRYVSCNICNKQMHFSGHFFDHDGIPLLFLFDCPSGHKPRKTVYPDGREYFFKKETCVKCGSQVDSKSHKENKILYTTTTCNSCGYVEKDEFDLSNVGKPVEPITEEDRQKYCLSFFNARTFIEDLESLANLAQSLDENMKEKQQMEEYEVEKIVKLTIPKLECLLQKELETAGFIKLTFEKPEMKTSTIVPFNLQDPTDRVEKDSNKDCVKCIQKSLALTNWRLSGTVDYRLGYLSGKLKAYETSESLLKLAKELKEKKMK